MNRGENGGIRLLRFTRVICIDRLVVGFMSSLDVRVIDSIRP
jgi:hypothetical protein